MALIGGRTNVLIDGSAIQLADTCKFSPNKVTREMKAGLHGVVGHVETPRAPYVECDAYFTDDTDLDAIMAVTDATVQVELANSKLFVLKNAVQVGDIEPATEDGKFTVKFEGKDCDIV